MKKNEKLLRETSPGDMLVDKDGDKWIRTTEGAMVRAAATEEEVIGWSESEMKDAEEQFGPFIFVGSAWDVGGKP